MTTMATNKDESSESRQRGQVAREGERGSQDEDCIGFQVKKNLIYRDACLDIAEAKHISSFLRHTPLSVCFRRAPQSAFDLKSAEAHLLHNFKHWYFLRNITFKLKK